MNIFANYLARRYEDIQAPLPFLTRITDPSIKKHWRQTKLIFSHGDKVTNIRESKQLAIDKTNLRYSTVTFLARNPISLLVSFYFHIKDKTHTREGDFQEFAMGRGGCDALIYYYNQVIPVLIRNPKARFVSYECFHKDAPDRLNALSKLVSHHLGELDEDAFNWAVNVCEFDALKQRAVRADSVRRVRQGDVIPSDRLVSEELSEKIQYAFVAGLHDDVRQVVRKRLPRIFIGNWNTIG